MATIITNCPQCKKQFKVPDEIAGKKIKCKGCGTAFVVTNTAVQPDAKPPAPGSSSKKPYDEDDGDGKPYGVTDLDVAPRCPNCANELEEEDQVICLICGFNNYTRQASKPRKIREPDGMEYFWWLLPGVLCVLLFFVCLAQLVNAIISRALIDMSDTSKFDTIDRSCVNCQALWCSIFCLWMMWLSGKFAVKRLILHWRPPEEELR
jgi:predicted Zn finger-like uncharacterized protein